MNFTRFLLLFNLSFVSVQAEALAFLEGRIDTNFLHILPDSNFSKEENTAIKNYQNRIFREGILLLEAKEDSDLDSKFPIFSADFCTNALFELCQWYTPQGESSLYFDFYFPRRSLLLGSSGYEKITKLSPEEYASEKIKLILSPFNPLESAAIKQDPLGLFSGFLMSKKSSNINPLSTYFKIASDSGHFGLIRYKLVDNNMETANQLAEYISVKKKESMKSELKVYSSSASLYLAKGSSSSIEEANRLAMWSLIGVIAIILIFFRSISPLIISFLNIIVSSTIGLVVLFSVYKTVHIASVLLCLSLVGVLADHCIHFFSHNQTNYGSTNLRNKNFLQPYFLSLFTSLLGYSIFYFSKIPILQQLSLFAFVSLLVSTFNIFVFFPRKAGKSKNYQSLTNDFFVHFNQMKNRFYSFGILATMFLVFVLCSLLFILPNVSFDDDINKLQAKDSSLLNEESIIKKVLEVNPSSGFYLVKSSSIENLLQEEESLISKLNPKEQSSSMAISSWVPSKKSQIESIRYTEELKNYLEELYLNLGVKNYKSIMNSAYKKTENLIFDISDWINVFERNPARDLYLGKIGDSFFSIVRSIKSGQLNTIEDNQSVRWIDSAKIASKSFAYIRNNIILYFSLFLGILFFLSLIKFGFLKTINLMIPPTFGVLSSILISHYYFGYLNLFSVLGCVLSFFLGIDYSLFTVFSENSNDRGAIMGVTVSLLTSLFSFGILIFSATTAIQQFSLSVSVGILVTYLFIFRFNYKENL